MQSVGYYPTVTRRPTRKKTKKTPAWKTRAAGKKAPRTIALGEPQLRWLDSVADSIVASGGPRFRREDIVQALVDANTARSLDPRAIRSLESLRIAFGAIDLSAVERVLENRPKLEPSVLAALKDSIK